MNYITESFTLGTVVVGIVGPRTVFTFKNERESWGLESLRPPPQVTRHKIVWEV